MSGQSGGRIRLAKLNDQLTCKLCGGYFIDATTIIECLHSFCRSCLISYLAKNKYCPICEVQVHKSKPLLNIRPDHTLQDIVYKLVPSCYQNEMRYRREFYEVHPGVLLPSMSPEERGEPIESHIYSPDESLSLSLEYYNEKANHENPVIIPVDDTKDPSGASGITLTPMIPSKIQPRRYLRCPAAVTVFHLQKLIRAKYGLSDAHRVDVMYKEESLCGNYSLMDVMYIYHWRRKVPLHLSYRIFESSPKRLKLSDDNAQFKEALTNAGISSTEPKDESTKREWKEVQLKISETGVMSVTGIHTSPESKKAKVESLEEEQRRLDESVAAVKSENIPESNEKAVVNDSDTNSADSQHSEQQQSQKPADKSTESPAESRKTTSAKPSESKQLSTNNNNNSNSNNYNSTSDTGVAVSSKTETREKNKNSATNDTKNSQLPSGSGSKIDALSAKLQFQPKVGPVNNTYSKKTLKEKKGASEKVLKKSEARNSLADGPKETKATAEKNRVMSNATTGAPSKSTNSQSKVTATSQSQSTSNTFLDSSSSNTSASTYSTITTPSVSISITPLRNSSPERGKDSTTPSHQSTGAFNKRRPSSSDTADAAIQRLLMSNPANAPARGSFARQPNNLPPSSESLEKIGLNVSTAILGLGSTGSPTFPYTVQDLVNNAMLKSLSKGSSGSSSQKQSTATSSSSQLTLQTPSMSFYSIPHMVKGNTSVKNPPNNSTKIKGSIEITTYSMPPCPDGIPISMMKPTVRKTEILAKGTNINDICAKIGASGSKINDICAKIGENSKEKIKSETRSRPEIPDLLKINKKPLSISSDSTTKHIPNIPNVPIYTPSNSLSSDSKNIHVSKDTSLKISTSTSSSTTPVTSTSSSTTPTSSTPTSGAHLSTTTSSFQMTGRGNSQKKNPTQSKNNYATKNQGKETPSQTQTSMASELSSTTSTSGKAIASKPAKIFKSKNAPRYLGNPASGVKPMYGENSEGKESNKDQSQSSTTISSSSKSSSPSMTKIDPKTLSPIVSTNTNSPIVSPPPYSPNARSYQNTPFSRSASSPMSPRNSPVNMVPTNPFIPSGKPNTNPRLFYAPFAPPFPDSSRFPNPLIRSPIGIPTHSAFHSSLPPSINKIYHQRTSYMPQTTSATYSQQSLSSQPPTVQRIPPSTHSSSPKSPKTTVASSTFNLAKTETQTSIRTSSASHLGKSATTQETQQMPSMFQRDTTNAFNLSKTGSNYASDLSKTSTSAATTSDKSTKSPPNPTTSQTKTQEKSKEPANEEVKEDKEEQNDGKKKKQEKEKKNTEKKDVSSKNGNNESDRSLSTDEKDDSANKVSAEQPPTKVNGSPSVETNVSESKESNEHPVADDKSPEKVKDNKNEGKNSVSLEKTNDDDKESLKHDDVLKSGEHIQTKKSETQRNKAES